MRTTRNTKMTNAHPTLQEPAVVSKGLEKHDTEKEKSKWSLIKKPDWNCYVCVEGRDRKCMCVCICVRAHACMCARVSACVHTWVHVRTHTCASVQNPIYPNKRKGKVIKKNWVRVEIERFLGYLRCTGLWKCNPAKKAWCSLKLTVQLEANYKPT